MKKFSSLKWLPYPNSWLNALMLSGVMAGFVTMIRRDDDLWQNLANWSQEPESVTLLLIFVIVLPIIAIAFLHHFFLSRFIPTIPGEKISNRQGFLPGLVSWRESLYGWLVLILSTLTAISVCTPLLPLFKINYSQIISESGQNYGKIRSIFAAVWLISAAIFYHIDYLFKLRLVFGNADSTESESVTVSTSSSDSLQPEDDVTQTSNTEVIPKNKSSFLGFNNKNSKTPRKIFTFVLVPIVALWLYTFFKLPEARQSISANIFDQKSSTLAANEAKPKDNYEKAINQARRTAKLAKLAQSVDEWKIVVDNWEEAIALMKTVPYISPNYGMAQQKIIQYQIHREFAQQYTISDN